MKCDNFLICDTPNPVISKIYCCWSSKLKMVAEFKMASKTFLFFTQYFQKLLFVNFIFCIFYLLWVKIRLPCNNYFLENSKWQNNLTWKTINFKILLFRTTERNVLIFWKVLVLMLYKSKNKPPFRLISWQHCLYFL
jgi:hypothetical protein